ncbi:MAG: Xaa-Pro aminopeptidase [Solirubrobacteraceae bacterium]|nr:Xaa-Pro aminopeptidase [Solirubrobacteraceae bacterium]
MTRADRIDARLQAAGADLLLVTDLVNVRYLTGFTGSNAMLVVGPGLRRFITDFRYVEQAGSQVAGFTVERAPQEFLAALREGWAEDAEIRLGFEDHRVTVRQHHRIGELLPEQVDLVAEGGMVEAERMVKDDGELAAIRAAAALADEALTEQLERGLTGRTEREVAFALEEGMRRRGAEPSFSSIVASGPHGALPHATPRDALIEAGVLVTIDWGAKLDGYCSDCTRTYATGDLPDKLRAVYELVERAQAAALAAVQPGAEGRAVDAVARDIIGAAGHAEHFGHGLGHGVGLEVHEGPRLAVTSTDTLAAGNVVTVEPGVYVPGLGGVRIEDLAVVAEGGPQVLSSLPKGLTVVR